MPYKNQADDNAHARRHKEAGYCVSCGNQRVNASHCASCRDAHNARKRVHPAAPAPRDPQGDGNGQVVVRNGVPQG